MALVNGSYLLFVDIKKFLENNKRKIGYGPHKNSGEQSRAILLAPLAVGQRAYVMVRCPLCVRPSVRPSVNFFFKHLL